MTALNPEELMNMNLEDITKLVDEAGKSTYNSGCYSYTVHFLAKEDDQLPTGELFYLSHPMSCCGSYYQYYNIKINDRNFTLETVDNTPDNDDHLINDKFVSSETYYRSFTMPLSEILTNY